MKKTITAKIGGKNYNLLFDMAAAIDAEESAGQSLYAMMNGEITMATLASLFHAGLKANHPMERGEAIALIEQAGVPAVMRWVSRGVTQLMTGNSPAKAKTQRKKAA